jgi:hypothetical protein
MSVSVPNGVESGMSNSMGAGFGLGLQTEYPFTLPRGFVDQRSGGLHREGVMRLATAADEILPLRDPRVQNNPAYLTIIVLARVVTQLGGLSDRDINPSVIEGLFAADLAYLQDLYNRINAAEPPTVEATCPSCQHGFTLEVAGQGEA